MGRQCSVVVRGLPALGQLESVLWIAAVDGSDPQPLQMLPACGGIARLVPAARLSGHRRLQLAQRAKDRVDLLPGAERLPDDQPKARTGSVTVPRAHVEALPDGSEGKLGVFLSNSKSRRAKLTVDKLRALAGLGLDWA